MDAGGGWESVVRIPWSQLEVWKFCYRHSDFWDRFFFQKADGILAWSQAIRLYTKYINYKQLETSSHFGLGWNLHESPNCCQGRRPRNCAPALWAVSCCRSWREVIMENAVGTTLLLYKSISVLNGLDPQGSLIIGSGLLECPKGGWL